MYYFSREQPCKGKGVFVNIQAKQKKHKKAATPYVFLHFIEIRLYLCI